MVASVTSLMIKSERGLLPSHPPTVLSMTLKRIELVQPKSFTTIKFPVVALLGTITSIVVDDKSVTDAFIPLNVAVVKAPKFVPVTFIVVPTGPLEGVIANELETQFPVPCMVNVRGIHCCQY